ncbi:lysozyme [Sphingobium yanoikuyae]|uniref:lysozyme n=1 Tax=Sphingobium yanoikuyae TaxID=13690 RepID=UPI003EFD292E
MKTSPAGRALITQYEGERLKSYLCPAGILTIGVGHTGPDVHRGQTITKEQSQKLLAADLRRFEAAVNRLGGTMSQHQFDALVSFAFNVGEGALAKSTLLRKHRAGDHHGAAREFSRWNRGGGKVLAGLVKRRAAEAALYLA